MRVKALASYETHNCTSNLVKVKIEAMPNALVEKYWYAARSQISMEYYATHAVWETIHSVTSS